MSKNRLMIQDFFRCYRPEDETHELAIYQFCAKRRFTLKIDGTPDERKPVTYQLFKKWFEDEVPDRGDVIVLPEEGIIGIIKMVGVNHTVGLFVSFQNGKLNTEPECYHYTSLRLAKEEEVLQLQRAFNENGFAWNGWRSKVKQREEPVENVQYQISVLGQKVGYGVFREIDAEDRIVMYCVKPEGQPVRYSLREVIGPVSDYQLEKINVCQRENLSEELSKAGMFWNGFFKRMEPIGYQLAPGLSYYYLNEFWEICRAPEQGKAKSLKYYNHGNYFRERKEIETLRMYLQEELSNHSFMRTEGKEYYYLKEFWKVCKTEDKGKPKDMKRAAKKNYFTSEKEALKVCCLLQERRNELFAQYSLPLPKRRNSASKR